MLAYVPFASYVLRPCGKGPLDARRAGGTMGKRVVLFLLTNLAIIVTLSILWSILSAVFGIEYGSLSGLAAFSLFWGMAGAFLSLAISRWIAKRAMGVQLIDGRTGNDAYDGLYETVARLSRAAGLPETPEVGIYDSPEVNAFATGPSKSRSLVAVSTGLLRSMDRREVEGVLGHEIAHVANGDMVTMTLIQGVVNAFVIFFARLISFAVRQVVDERIAGIVGFAVWIVAEIFLGILGMMVVGWFSRRREFRADSGGAGLAGREAMLSALRRLQTTADAVDRSHPALASLKISGTRHGIAALMATHPPLEERIRALEMGR